MKLSQEEIARIKAAKNATVEQNLEWLNMAMRIAGKTMEMRKKQGKPYIL
jgi:hypothetical protein